MTTTTNTDTVHASRMSKENQFTFSWASTLVYSCYRKLVFFEAMAVHVI